MDIFPVSVGGDGKNYRLVLDSSVGVDKTVEPIVNYVDMHL